MNLIASLLKSSWTYVIIIIGALLAMLWITRTELANTKIAYAITKNNEVAAKTEMKKWEDRYGQEHAKTIMFNQNLTDFKLEADSQTLELIKIIKEQNYDIRKLRQASYVTTAVTTQLTKEIQTKLPDTVVDLSNKDIKNVITLSPYRISSDIEFYNTQYLLFSDSTIKTFIPRRYDFFLKRWFQQKEKTTVVKAEVINSNPLMKVNKQKFIHIIGKKEDD